MKRFACMGTAVVLTLAGALAIRAQDESDTLPSLIEAKKREPRHVAEAYLAAALAGKMRDAAPLLTAKIPHPVRLTKKEWLEEFREALGVESLEIFSVRFDEEQGTGVAVSQPVKLPKPHPDVGDTGWVVLQLNREEGQWRVRDVDIWSKVLATNALKRYEKKRSTDQTHEVEPAPAAEPSTSRNRAVGGGLGGGGLGGGGFGGFGRRGAHPLPNDATPTPKYTVGKKIIVSMSENGDAVWGFSKTTGNWTKQEIRPASKDELRPTVSFSVASLQVGKRVYAFSGQTGRWDVLRLAVDQKPRVQVHLDMVLVTDGQTIYTFADATGRWSSNAGPQTEALPERNPERLDRLTQTLQQLEERSLVVARQFRQWKSVKIVDRQQLSKMKAQVRKAVSDAFEARQELQQAELDELRARLLRVQQLIETREGIEEKIIDRRVEELLNQELSWD
jgi:hypothetical protein